MKKLFSTKYSAGSFNVAMLLLRVGIGGLMLTHGYDKLVHFDTVAAQFINFLGLGQKVSLSLCIFAEFFCSALLILGLFTRLAAFALIVNMCVIIFQVFHGKILDPNCESAVLYLTAYLVIILVGPGKASVDGMIGK